MTMLEWCAYEQNWFHPESNQLADDWDECTECFLPAVEPQDWPRDSGCFVNVDLWDSTKETYLNLAKVVYPIMAQWDEPTQEELQALENDYQKGTKSYSYFVDARIAALRLFVRRRNEALQPKPKPEPTVEELKKELDEARSLISGVLVWEEVGQFKPKATSWLERNNEQKH